MRWLLAARTSTEEQVMEEEEEEEEEFFLPLSSPLNERATRSCCGNIFSDCQSSRDCSEGLCNHA